MRKKISLVLSAAISVVLLYFLLSNISLGDVIRILKNSSLPVIIAGLFLYLLSLYTRAVRFNILLNNKIGLKTLFPITLFYNFANTVIPMRLGELSYVYLLKKTKNISGAKGLSTLIVSRVFDFMFFILALFLTVLLAKDIPAELLPMMPSVIIFLSVLILGIFILLFWQAPIFSVFYTIHNLFTKKKSTFVKRKFTEFIDSFREMKSKKTILMSLILSIIINFLLIAYTIILARAMGFNYPDSILVAVICLSVLFSVIPISGINGFGTTETIWAVIMMAFGYTLNEGVILSFSLHIIQTIYLLIFGFIGWLGIRRIQ